MTLDIYELMDPSLRKPLKESTLALLHQCHPAVGETRALSGRSLVIPRAALLLDSAARRAAQASTRLQLRR